LIHLAEQNAVNEAKRLNIPIVAIVDTNADPGNDRLSDSGKRRRDSRHPDRLAETCLMRSFRGAASTDSRANRDGWRFCLTRRHVKPQRSTFKIFNESDNGQHLN